LKKKEEAKLGYNFGPLHISFYKICQSTCLVGQNKPVRLLASLGTSFPDDGIGFGGGCAFLKLYDFRQDQF